MTSQLAMPCNTVQWNPYDPRKHEASKVHKVPSVELSSKGGGNVAYFPCLFSMTACCLCSGTTKVYESMRAVQPMTPAVSRSPGIANCIAKKSVQRGINSVGDPHMCCALIYHYKVIGWVAITLPFETNSLVSCEGHIVVDSPFTFPTRPVVRFPTADSLELDP